MSSFSSLSRLTLGVAATAVTSSSASAAIVVFDINPDFTTDASGYGGITYVDTLNFSNGTFTSFSDTGFSLYNNYTEANFWSGNIIAATISGDLLLTAGTTIGLPNASGIFAPVSIGFDKSETPVGTYYIALMKLGGPMPVMGWLEFVATDTPFNADPTDTYNTLTFTRFAFNDVAGQSITAGDTGTPIPEASSLGFAGGLFGLVVAAHLRRRKAAQAAAPDSLLKLAGGEFRN